MARGGFEAPGPRAVTRTVLVASGTERGRDVLKRMTSGGVFRPAAFAASGGEARRALLAGDFDAVIVNCPLPDEFGVELACFAAEEGLAALLVVKNEQFAEASARAGACGALTLSKPFSREQFAQALSLLEASQRRVELARREAERLRAKVEELRAVCRAKCLLVEFRGLTEPEAHRAIEKESMDRRLSRRAVAEQIIAQLSVE